MVKKSMPGKATAAKKKIARKKRTLALVCSSQLFSEIMHNLLAGQEDICLLDPWDYGDQVLERLAQSQPDLVVVAGDCEPPCDDISHLIAQIMEAFPQIPLLRLTLSHNDLRIYTCQRMPANSLDFLNLVRTLPLAN